MAEPALPESVIRAASEWFVRLGAEEAGAADEAAWRDWLAADARHRRAWARVEALGRQFGQVQARAGLAALERPASGGRRRALKISLAAGTGGLTAAGLPWRAWTSDLSAGIGQTRVATLDDGSLLTLNTGSAADVRFSDALRLIVLRQGELHIATYRDAMTPARPLAVDTPMGRVLALGTRYLVRLHDDRVRVVVNDGAVRIEPAAAGAAGACRLEAGEGAWFDARARGRPDPRCTKTPGFKGRYMPTTCVWTRSSRNWGATGAAGWPAIRPWRVCAFRDPSPGGHRSCAGRCRARLAGAGAALYPLLGRAARQSLKTQAGLSLLRFRLAYG